jgi:hypothetical protein
MIKYMELEGYNNLRELGLMSHLYSLISNDGKIILIRAYDITPAKLWHGIILQEDKSYTNFNLGKERDKIISKIKYYVGDIKIIEDLKEFSKDTVLEEYFKEYKCND